MKVKADFAGDNVFLYTDENYFILDSYGGLPSEGQLGYIWENKLPEIEVYEKTETIEYEGKIYKAYWRLGEYDDHDHSNDGVIFHKGYDSTADTLKHILRVNELLHMAVKNLLGRADKHDRSKLVAPEKRIFDIFTPKLRTSVYGSEEYKGFLKEMKVALDNHYKENKAHHPDSLPNGIKDMDILDMVEMLLDWKCASERHATGNIMKSIDIQKERFNLPEELVCIFKNSAKNFGWVND